MLKSIRQNLADFTLLLLIDKQQRYTDWFVHSVFSFTFYYVIVITVGRKRLYRMTGTTHMLHASKPTRICKLLEKRDVKSTIALWHGICQFEVHVLCPLLNWLALIFPARTHTHTEFRLFVYIFLFGEFECAFTTHWSPCKFVRTNYMNGSMRSRNKHEKKRTSSVIATQLHLTMKPI